MSDEPRDDAEAEDPADDQLPEDDKGLGLTEEFARIEAEIDAELGRSADLDAPDDVPDEPEAEEPDEGPKPDEPTAVRWDDDDSAEWPVAPVLSTGVHGPEDLSKPDPAPEEPAAAAEGEPGDSAPELEPEPAPAPEPEEPALEHTVIRHGTPAPVAIAAGGGYGAGAGYVSDDELAGPPPRLWWRFLTASILIIAATATAVSLSSLLFLTDVAARLQPIPGLADKLPVLEPGEPQTILIVGSDKRSNTPGDPGRSDTTMLLRVDADEKVLSLFSLPRDLRVDIAGRNFGPAKLNEAYTDGGIKKTLATVKNLTGLEISHVVNIDFQGFADAVDAIGCVYVDIDRDYFNDNSLGFEEYATIDVNAGYQRLCGSNALDYVRYRHTDTTFVRDARQQDFLRNARAQVPVSQLAPPVFGGDGASSELIDIFTEYTSSDIHTSAQVISLLKAFLIVKDVPIKEVHIESADEIIDGISFVTATDEQIQKAVDEFLGEKDSEGSRGGSNANEENGDVDKATKEEKKEEEKAEDPVAGADVLKTGDLPDPETGTDKYEAFGRTSARRLKFPIYIPNLIAPGSLYDDGSRQYEIMDPEDDVRPSYKMVISLENPAVNLEYYGIQGTTWDDPPILNDPSETQTIDGRDYDLYYDGDRLRMVAFHEGGNAYWVSNTLLQTLDEPQMMAIATSMTEVKEK